MNPFDPELGIDWPVARESLIISAKDQAAPLVSSPEVQNWIQHCSTHTPRKCEVLLIGEKGYFGVHYVKWLESKGVDYVACDARLHQRELICHWLDKCQPVSVICPAGIAGKPNISWCSRMAVSDV